MNNNSEIFKKIYEEIESYIPGNKKIKILNPSTLGGVEQWYINELNKISDNTDTVILHTLDVFPLRNNTNIFNHSNLKNKKLFLLHLGYKNKKINDSQWEISCPMFYFSRDKKEKNIKQSNLPYKFSCLNNRVSMHRLMLGYNLHKKNLLDKIIYTQNNYGGWWINNSYSPPDAILTISDFQNYLDLLPIRYYNDLAPYQFINDHSTNHDAYTQAYCNIVTESEAGDDIYQTPTFNDTLEVITEKSYKPFISCQVPLFLACKGHLAHLKNLGFEVMEDLLPSGYDNMGVYEKISAIVEIVSRGDEFMEDFYFSHLKEIEHNYNLITSDYVDQLIINNIKNTINESL